VSDLMSVPTSVEETLWKIVSGSPTPEELAAVTVVLSLLFRQAEETSAPAPVIPLARWKHATAPGTAGSWRAPERIALTGVFAGQGFRRSYRRAPDHWRPRSRRSPSSDHSSRSQMGTLFMHRY
jgi:hypothetical protein